MRQHRRPAARFLIESLESRLLFSVSAALAEEPLAPAEPAVLAAAVAAVNQPSILHTQADFDRMAAKVAAGEQPWLSGWNAFIADGYSQLGATPRPLETVIRGGTGQNFAQMYIDIARTYQSALRWKVSGDTRYADQAVQFLNAWSSTMTTLTGNSDRFLASGLYAYTWAVAADIMKSYEGWAAEDVTRFQDYLLGIYYPMQHDFLVNHNGAYITNYWANWDLANIEGMMAIGIFTGRQDLYDEAMAYLHQGGGNGALDKIVYYMHPGRMAQWQESGRDQGHTLLGMMLFGHIAQMAWNQGDDLFSYNNYQFLAAAEYIAKYNAGYDVPYEEYYWGNGQTGAWSQQTVIGSGSRGNGTYGYELIYAHYVNRLGMAAPYTTQRVMALRPEYRVTNGDGFGFGTLTMALDSFAGLQQPRGLTAAERGAGTIRLDWYGSSAATSYNLYRATSPGGTYTRIASDITGLLTYTDTPLAAGVYYYKVTGNTAAGETVASNVVSATASSQLHTQLAFDNTTADASGNGHDGTLVNGPLWSSGVYAGAIALDGVDDYVELPGGFVNDVADFTIATWVNLNSAATWSRIFDFGDSRGRWMFLTPRNSSGKVEFATSTTYGYNKQVVTGATALPTNQWVHVAVTLADRTATLYVNGVAVGSNSNMDFPPVQIGATARNWIGRSQFSNDPYLNGRVDDFRIYRGALQAGELYTMATGTPAPAVPAAPASLTATAVPGNQINLAWSAVSGATGYTVRRSTTSGGPYTTIATLVTGTTYADTGRTAGTTYYYVVTASNNGGDGAVSPQASATALPPLPSVPGGLVAQQISSNAVSLSWTAGANNAAYNVKRATISGGPYTTVASNVTGTSFTDTGLTSGTTYYYAVSATNAAGESANTAEAAATPTADKLTGTTIGTSGSWGNNPATYRTVATDGNLATFFDAAIASGAWVGLDLGTAATIAFVRYAPRSTYESRMVGGVFQGANSADFSDAVTLATVATQPTANTYTTLAVTDAGAYRYVRYLGPDNGYSNVAEIEFWHANAAPTVASAAAAASNPVTGTQVALSVLGADDQGAANLLYTWSAAGPAAVTFSANGSNAAQNAIATFTRAGSYTFTATITDPGKLTTTSSVTVIVAQTLAVLTVSPANNPTVTAGSTLQFSAAGVDQFGQAMTVSPSWATTGSGNTISGSGLFTAGPTAGTFTVTASSAGVSGTASVTVAAASTFTGEIDLGNATAIPGSYTLSNGQYTVRGSGSDIWSTSDSFHYVYVPFTGDGQIMARVTAVQNTNSWAKAGVMFRASLAANSVNTFIAVTPSQGITFQRRTTTGGSTSSNTKSSLKAPYWVKLVRSGNTFQGFYSSNGTSWTRLGSNITIAMGSTIYVGLAVTSHSSSALNTSSFDNVSITPLTNLAAGKAISASSTASGSSAANAVDGSTASSWVSASTGTQTLTSDLGSSRSVSRITVTWGAGYARSFSVQVSSNGTSWTSVYSTSSGSGGTLDLTGLLLTSRYVRLRMTSGVASSYAVAELAVIGV